MLKGLKILDLSRVLAGPYATQVLGDLGATVYKIEKPNVGDDTRSWGPPYTDTKMSAYFMSCNRNKQSVSINIATRQGQDLVRQMAAMCDVMIENYQVGKLKEYGLDYESIIKIKKDMIYVSLTGYGQTGSKKDLPGYDFIVQGESGVMSITGSPNEEPMKVGVAISDIMTGMHAVTGILTSVIHRNNTCQGQYIDLSLFDCSLSYLANQGMNYLIGDHPIVIAVGNDKQFREFCEVIGLELEEKYRTNQLRVMFRDELSGKISAKLEKMARDVWIEKLHAKNIPCGKVNTIQEAFSESQVKERNMIWNVSRDGKEYPTIGNPLRFSNDLIESHDKLPPPLLGEHTEQVLDSLLSLTPQEIENLKSNNII